MFEVTIAMDKQVGPKLGLGLSASAMWLVTRVRFETRAHHFIGYCTCGYKLRNVYADAPFAIDFSPMAHQ